MGKLKQKIPEALKQVSLEEWSERQIATEGIADVFSGIKKTIKEWNENRIRRRKKPDPLRHKNLQMSWYWIAREIKRTYLNPIWLSGRESILGEIPASGFISGLTFTDYVTNDAALAESAANQILNKVASFVPVRKAYIEAFEREIMDRLVAGRFNDYAGRINVQALTMAVEVFFKTHGGVSEMVERALGKVEIALPENYLIKSSHRGLQIVPGKLKKAIATLPALTKEQIVNAGHALIKALDKVPAVYLDTDSLVLNIVDDYVLEYVDEAGELKLDIAMTSLEIKKAFALVRNDDLRALLDEMSWNDHFYVPIITAFDQLVKGMISAERYMAESIN